MLTYLREMAKRVWEWAQGGEEMTLAVAADLSYLQRRETFSEVKAVEDVIARMEMIKRIQYTDTQLMKVNDHAAQAIVDLLSLIEHRGGDADALLREILE